MNDAPDLSPRLRAVAAGIPRGSRVADIGSDHGRLAAWLVARERARRVIATEVDRRRLPPARDGVEARVGPGLEPIAPEDGIDVVVVAGLGGRSIVAILDDRRLDAVAPSRLVLQPQNRARDVRAWLVANGWRLEGESLVRDRGRRYLILVAMRGAGEEALVHPDLGRDEMLDAGPVLVGRRDREAREAWAERVRRLEAAASRATGASLGRVSTRLASSRRILRALGG